MKVLNFISNSIWRGEEDSRINGAIEEKTETEETVEKETKTEEAVESAGDRRSSKKVKKLRERENEFETWNEAFGCCFDAIVAYAMSTKPQANTCYTFKMNCNFSAQSAFFRYAFSFSFHSSAIVFMFNLFQINCIHFSIEKSELQEHSGIFTLKIPYSVENSSSCIKSGFIVFNKKISGSHLLNQCTENFYLDFFTIFNYYFHWKSLSLSENHQSIDNKFE